MPYPGLFPMEIDDSVTVLSVKYLFNISTVLKKSRSFYLVFITKGILSYQIKGNTIKHNNNKAAVILSSDEELHLLPSENCIYTIAEFTIKDDIFSNETFSRIPYALISLPPSDRDIFKISAEASLSPSKVKERLAHFFDHAIKQIQKDSFNFFKYDIQPDLMKKAKRFIDDNFTKNISVSTVAENIYLSDGYFSRCFKAAYGITPKNYMLKKKVETAKALLESTNYPSGRIALMVGFSSPQRFNEMFKKYVGQSPLKYKKSV